MKLISKMPRVYEPVGMGKKAEGEGKTHYQVFTGPETLLDGTRKIRLHPLHIPDGTSNTIMAVEARDPVIWTKPEDLVLPKDKDKMPAVGGLFKDGARVAMCDRVVRVLPHNVTPAVMRALVTPNGGETVDLDKLKP